MATELEPFIFQKNDRTQVRVYESEFKGKVSLHIREWWFDGNDEEWKPSQKGVSIPKDTLGDFLPGLIGFTALLQTPASAPLPKVSNRKILKRSA